MPRRSDTTAHKDRFLIAYLSHSDEGRAYREAGLAPATKERDGLGKAGHNLARDKRNGQRLLKDPYIADKLAGAAQQLLEKLSDDAEATRYEIMNVYRKVIATGLDSGLSRELNAVVRAADGMAKMMGYCIEHKIIHHERSDKQIDRMSSADELRIHIRSIAVELGEPTMRLLTGETTGGGNGEIIDVTPDSTA